MVKQTIQIFARIKPIRQAKTGLYEVDDDEEGCPRLQLIVPRELAAGFINNKKENYSFRFNRIFDQKILQDEVFACVAQPVIDNVLQGFNGTIFAYGQTGSGKTFTITGGPERYSDRGIIPRSLSYIFNTIEKNSNKVYTVNISYLEIYNENGYDLLDPRHEAAKLEDLPKVSLMEDADQNIHLKNLTVHQANSEEDALNLLFMGDTNRMIAETPMNQASSRSHCIFTIHLTSKDEGSATIRRAKLHLVDLAGSERVSKTGVNGVILTEAKYINLSLHYLEQVILALSEKNRQHVPYRNSMMTSVLRDSLGGNCMTTMIATCSMEKSNIDESISTCRFAQRVAMIKNEVTLNEELDPRLLIAKLKRENAELREQLALAVGEQLSAELSQESIESCENSVTLYLHDLDPETRLDVGPDLRKIQRCFFIMKRLIHEKPLAASHQMEFVSSETSFSDIGPYKDAESRKLKELLEQRDNEINILVNMLKNERKKVLENQRSPLTVAYRKLPHSANEVRSEQLNGRHKLGHTSKAIWENGKGDLVSPALSKGSLEQQGTFDVARSSSATIDEGDAMKAKLLGDMSLGRQEAFDIFMQDYQGRDKIETSKQFLKQRYNEAKALGEQLNKSKQKMNILKNSLSQYRMQSQGEPNGESDLEAEIKKQMEEEKFVYKKTFVSLRSLKTEIEHMQHLLENLKVKLMKDFDLWWAEQTANSSRPQAVAGDSPPWTSSQMVVPSAWKTPPITSPTHTPPGGQFSSRAFSHENLSSLKSDADSRNYTTLARTNSKPALEGLTFTGDSKVDADIEAFVRARQNILRKVNANQR